MPLTDFAVRNLKPRERTYRKSDAAGLFLEIRSEGGRYWRLAYRFKGVHSLQNSRMSLPKLPTACWLCCRLLVDCSCSSLFAGNGVLQWLGQFVGQRQV
jgi:hypothetical protein